MLDSRFDPTRKSLARLNVLETGPQTGLKCASIPVESRKTCRQSKGSPNALQWIHEKAPAGKFFPERRGQVADAVRRVVRYLKPIPQ